MTICTRGLYTSTHPYGARLIFPIYNMSMPSRTTCLCFDDLVLANRQTATNARVSPPPPLRTTPLAEVPVRLVRLPRTARTRTTRPNDKLVATHVCGAPRRNPVCITRSHNVPPPVFIVPTQDFDLPSTLCDRDARRGRTLLSYRTTASVAVTSERTPVFFFSSFIKFFILFFFLSPVYASIARRVLMQHTEFSEHSPAAGTVAIYGQRCLVSRPVSTRYCFRVPTSRTNENNIVHWYYTRNLRKCSVVTVHSAHCFDRFWTQICFRVCTVRSGATDNSTGNIFDLHVFRCSFISDQFLGCRFQVRFPRTFPYGLRGHLSYGPSYNARKCL